MPDPVAPKGAPSPHATEVAAIAAAVFGCATDRCLHVTLAVHDYLRTNAPAFATDADAMLWARNWAAIASPAERKAYALACFEAMPEDHQKAFLDHIAGTK